MSAPACLPRPSVSSPASSLMMVPCSGPVSSVSRPRFFSVGDFGTSEGLSMSSISVDCSGRYEGRPVSTSLVRFPSGMVLVLLALKADAERRGIRNYDPSSERLRAPPDDERELTRHVCGTDLGWYERRCYRARTAATKATVRWR